MTGLGSSPPTVCTCGHSPDDHEDLRHECRACLCPLFERDEDR